ncbi:hypothetical protein NADFUDRAFT_80513 [Nadsonia fulvescens var. elongata DSM 6958]|uniref:U1 small nuclear ribonucleoprotein component SNU71 n=1 Tax=Nadsonia fulvescens var. elongata DSM 6958 TaxID=857566 RepID=A0A1E3PEF4_9ASCO|nr:hypothetical protein NADFUDRAFT_80513 [Nadsonia fulvescens var. elongata DSM 6958]
MYRQPYYNGYHAYNQSPQGQNIRNGQYGAYGSYQGINGVQLRSTSPVVEVAPLDTKNINLTEYNNLSESNDTSMKTVSSHLSTELSAQLCTLFIFGLPRHSSETALGKIFQSLMGFKSWFRIKNAHGQNCSFGFLQFDSVNGVANGLAILESPELVDLPIKVKAENNTRKWIEASHPAISESVNSGIIEQISLLIRSEVTSSQSDNINAQPTDDITLRTDELEPELEINDSMAMNAEELASIPIESKDVIMDEIQEFRVQSKKFEKNRQLVEREEEKKRQIKSTEATLKALTEPSNDLPTSEKSPSLSTRDLYSTTRDVRDDTDSRDDLTIEKQRQESINAKLEFEFQDRQSRWMNRERIHKSALDRDIKRKQSELINATEQRQLALQRLADFIDGGDYESKHFEYYYDHASWIKDRLAYRSRELDADRRDRELEGDIENEESDKTKQLEKSTDKFLYRIGTGIKLSLSDATISTTPTATTAASTTASTTTTTSTAPSTTTITAPKLFEEDEPTKPRTMFRPVALTADEPASLEALEASIPKDTESLFAHIAAWDQLDDSIIEQHLRPVIEAKILEYIGIKEEDLIEFVVDYIRGEGRDPRELLKEMEMTLDEDAELFTTTVWRQLVLQLEKKRLGL